MFPLHNTTHPQHCGPTFVACLVESFESFFGACSCERRQAVPWTAKLGLFALLLRCLALFWVFFWFFWLLSHLALDLHVSRQVAWTLKPESIDVLKMQSCIHFATSAFEASFPFVSACNLLQPWAEQVLTRSLPIMCYALAWNISLITL